MNTAPRSVRKVFSASARSGCASSTVTPSRASFSAAALHTARTSRSTARAMPRSVLNAIRARFVRPRRGLRKARVRPDLRQRVERMPARLAVEHERRVRDVARHRPLDRQRVERLLGGARHHARARAQSRRRAVARRRADAAAEVAAGREPYLARRRAPPPIPPEEPLEVVRMSHGLSVAPNTSLNVLPPAANSGRLDLADHDRAVRLQPLHDDVGRRRDAVRVDARAGSAAHALRRRCRPSPRSAGRAGNAAALPAASRFMMRRA